MSLRLIDLSSLLRHHAVSHLGGQHMVAYAQKASTMKAATNESPCARNGDELAEASLKPIQLHQIGLGVSQCVYLIMISGSGLAVQ